MILSPYDNDEYADVREGVRRLCADFPGDYWRKLDETRSYPTEFVNALTEAGYLSVLIPEEYGGSGLGLSAAAAVLETIQAEGCNGGACHAQMYTMGTILRHGSEEQKQKYLPGIASGKLRLQAFGVTEPTSGTDTTALRTFAKRAPVRAAPHDHGRLLAAVADGAYLAHFVGQRQQRRRAGKEPAAEIDPEPVAHHRNA